MRPVPSTAAAEALYGPFVRGDRDLMEHFVSLSVEIGNLVPDCVGMSISLREEGVTLTLVATDAEVALFDAVQYADGGPCVDALDAEVVIANRRRLSIEAEWDLFTKVTHAQGVRSTLSMPVPSPPGPSLGLNLYASTTTAFDDHHAAIAELVGAEIGELARNADLRFSSRDRADLAPEILKLSTDLAAVAGRLSRDRGITDEEAHERLQQAAVRAGVPLSSLVASLLDVMES